MISQITKVRKALQKKMNERKSLKSFGEAEYQISADYRRHFEEMRDSSVATSSAQRRPFLSSISFGRNKRNGQTDLKGAEHLLIYP